MRKFVLSSVLLPLVFAAPALAVPPTTEVTVVELGDFAAENTELCGFTIFFDESGSFKVKTFYDAQGNPVRTILTNFKDRYTATATANGKTLSTNYPLAVIDVWGGPEGGDGAPKRVQGPRSRGGPSRRRARGN